MDNIQQIEEKIIEKPLWNLGNMFLALVIGVSFAAVEVILLILLKLDIPKAIFSAMVLLVVYALILFFLLEPRSVKEIHRGYLQTKENTVVKEVPVDRPVIKQVIKEVPVIQEVQVDRPVIQEVQVPVYMKRNLDIPKYEYIGSSETKVFHKRSCRLRKIIKNKYKVSNNSASYFIKNKFVPCKICKPKK